MRKIERGEGRLAGAAGRRFNKIPPKSGGSSAGFWSGLAMLAAAMAVCAAAGRGAGFPLRLVAAAWQGQPALAGGAWTLTVGLGTHMLVATLLGAIFATALRRGAGAAEALGWGIAYAVGVCVAMVTLALPRVDPILAGHALSYPGVWLGLHVLYGAGLGLVPGKRQTSADDLVELAQPTTFY